MTFKRFLLTLVVISAVSLSNLCSAAALHYGDKGDEDDVREYEVLGGEALGSLLLGLLARALGALDDRVRRCWGEADGVDRVCQQAIRHREGVAHIRAGELVVAHAPFGAKMFIGITRCSAHVLAF